MANAKCWTTVSVQFPWTSSCTYLGKVSHDDVGELMLNYCVYHLAHAARGYSLTDVVNRFSPTDWSKNEKKVLDFVEKILDSRL